MKREMSAEKARLRLAGLCARGEHCSHEMQEKCRKWGLGEADTREVIKYLVDHKFVDDQRFAHAFANDKFKYQGWGPLKIRQALAVKGFRSEAVQEALADIVADEEGMRVAIRRIAKAKASSLDLTDPGDRQKLFRHLASRGFYPAQIIAALKRQ